jgi:hypothetical protein
MIWDLFPFNDELDLLELRLAELDSIVDVFGIVEMRKTFSGNPKPLNLTNNLSRFARWKDKIRIYVPPVIPDGRDHIVDWFQRRQTAKFIANAFADDVVMLSDVDEIPNREAVRQYLEDDPGYPVCLVQRLYYYRVNIYDPAPWPATVICRRESLGADPDMQSLREARGMLPSVGGGGWHFSWLGSPEQIMAKLDAVVDIDVESKHYGSDGIVKPPRDLEFFANCIASKSDMFGRAHRPKQVVPIVPGTNQPFTIEEWLARFSEYA